MQGEDVSVRSRSGRRWLRRVRRRLAVTGLALAACVLQSGLPLATAAGGAIDLGKLPSHIVAPEHFPLSGFHRVPLQLRSHSKPEFLWIGTGYGGNDRIVAERWPVVKALEQFGSMSNVRPVERGCGPINNVTLCTIPSFDWSHAAYRSRYVSFVHKEVLDQNNMLYQPLSRGELAIYNRYARYPGNHDYADSYNFAQTAGAINGSRALPLVTVGDYLQTVSEITIPGDFEQDVTMQGARPDDGPTIMHSGLPFATVRSALAAGKDPQGTHLVEDVGAEASIMVALICHADGMRPTHVCGRPAIKRILRHVK